MAKHMTTVRPTDGQPIHAPGGGVGGAAGAAGAEAGACAADARGAKKRNLLEAEGARRRRSAVFHGGDARTIDVCARVVFYRPTETSSAKKRISSSSSVSVLVAV